MYLVVWTIRHGNDANTDQDHWEVCETLAEAKARYGELLKQTDVYSASVAAVVESTDYPEAP